MDLSHYLAERERWEWDALEITLTYRHSPLASNASCLQQTDVDFQIKLAATFFSRKTVVKEKYLIDTRIVDASKLSRPVNSNIQIGTFPAINLITCDLNLHCIKSNFLSPVALGMQTIAQ